MNYPSAKWLLSVAAILCVPLLGAAQTLVITLTPSNYNGFNVSCFGLKDGTLSAAVTGGTPPYTYTWSTAETTQSISGLAAGYYHLSVKDALSAKEDAEITLTEPNTMRVAANPHVFSNDYNISCYECSNGSIQVTVADGVAPYTFLWDDGPTNQNRWGLDQGFYQVTVSDANACEALQVGTYISRPDRSDWTMGGNTGSDPETDYIGTADEQDVVLKSNGTERLRIKSNGDISLLGNAAIGKGIMYVGVDGILKAGIYDYLDPLPVGPCFLMDDFIPFWKIQGNTYPGTLCEDLKLGTKSSHAFQVITNDVVRMLFKEDGKVSVGSYQPSDQFEVQTSMANSGISLMNLTQGASARTVVRFKKGDINRWELGCDLNQNGTNNFFLWDAQATPQGGALRMIVDENGKVGIGMQPTTGPVNGYRLYVEDGIATRDVLVKLDGFPDYVFNEDYPLPSLAELKDYLQANKHLPGIPSAAEVEEKGGVEVGDLQRRMLETVEQQALYILQLEERMRAMELRLETLEAGK